MASPPARPPLPVGIDLGTTMSTLAYVEGTSVECLRGADGVLMPSAVFVDQTSERILVGSEALRLGPQAPDHFADCFKRDMGKPHYRRKLVGNSVPPEVLSALVLERLKQQAERILGPVRQAVITVPAYFDERRRTATQQAGKLAGLEVLDIVNEPVAAALAHAYRSGLTTATADRPDRPLRMLVYDFGGGTFDVSVLQFEGSRFATLATDGDVHLGGHDFDERLVDYLAEQFRRTHRLDPRTEASDRERLWQVARDAKHTLTKRERCMVSIQHARLLLNVELTRSQFEELVEPLVERTLNTCVDVMEASHLGWQDLDHILLAGGLSRVPLVSRKLKELTGHSPHLPENPDELVALGAALFAAAHLPGQSISFQVANVNSHSLGVWGTDAKTREPINKILIPRNTPLPACATHTFVTPRSAQTSVYVTVLEGENENPKLCSRVGHCRIDLDPDLPGGSPVEVTCSYESNGTLSVSARVIQTRQSASLVVQRTRQQHLESLEVWRSRLVSGAEPGAPTGELQLQIALPECQVTDRGDPAQLAQRLDYLHAKLGMLCQGGPLPGAALPSQRALRSVAGEVNVARQVLLRIERAIVDAQDTQQRAELVGCRAQTHLYLSEAEALVRHSLVALGRTCADCALVPSGGESFLEEIAQLEALLRRS